MSNISILSSKMKLSSPMVQMLNLTGEVQIEKALNNTTAK